MLFDIPGSGHLQPGRNSCGESLPLVLPSAGQVLVRSAHGCWVRARGGGHGGLCGDGERVRRGPEAECRPECAAPSLKGGRGGNGEGIAGDG